MRLVFSSDRPITLSSLQPGETGVVVAIDAGDNGRTDRLLALGVTPGATVTVLQVYPGIVFLCDQTEIAIERAMASGVIVQR